MNASRAILLTLEEIDRLSANVAHSQALEDLPRYSYEHARLMGNEQWVPQ